MNFNVDINEYSQVNSIELEKKLIDTIKSILINRFPNEPNKQQLPNLKNSRLNIACPICGDSKSFNSPKKRAYVYLDSFFYKCYNGDCPTPYMDFDNFLKKFNKIDLFSQAELNYIKKNSQNFEISDGVSNKKLDFQRIYKDESLSIPRQDLIKKLQLVNVEDSMNAMKYLQGRYQLSENYKDNLRFAWHKFTGNLYIFNLSNNGEGVVSFQIRFSQLSQKGMRFFTYNYSRMKEKIFEIKDLDNEEKIRMDKISLIYNIYGIDLAKKITIFESSIDSHHVHNSLAQWGTNNKVVIKNARYIFDNSTIDDAGFKAGKGTLLEGYDTFLWKKFLKNYPEYYNSKDLNKIFVDSKGKFNVDILDKYFGNERLDLIYL